MQQSMMGLNSRNLLFASGIAGVVIGLLSGIPLISCVNCLLMAWVWGGAIFAVMLYRNREGRPPLTIAQGLLIGALAGAIGAVVGGILGLIFSGLSASLNAALTQLAGESGQQIPDFLFATGANIVSMIVNIFVYAVVGAIGGAIATGLIWKAPAVTPPPPTYYPPQQ